MTGRHSAGAGQGIAHPTFVSPYHPNSLADSPESGQITGWNDKNWGRPVDVDLRNAGGRVVDEEAAVDGNIITSRNPAFTKALIAQLQTQLEKGKALETA